MEEAENQLRVSKILYPKILLIKMQIKFLKKYSLSFLILAVMFLALQSCNNLFVNPQPIDVLNESKIPSNFHGIYKTPKEDLKFEVGSDFIYTEELKAFEDEKKVYFVEGNIGYVVVEGKKQKITNVSLIEDSVFGDLIIRNEYKINKNLILKKVKEFYVFNFREYGESWSPCFLYKDENTYISSILKSEILENFSKNDDSNITENFDFEDVSYFFKRKEKFLNPILSFNTKTKIINKIDLE